MIQTLQQVGIEGTYLNIIKATEDKYIANIKLNGEKPKAFSFSNSWKRQGYPLWPLLFNIVLEVIATAIREKHRKGIQIWKEVKLMTWYTQKILKVPKDGTRKLLELINESGQVVGYKINTQKLLHFYILTTETEIKEAIPFTTASKRIKYQGINLPKETKKFPGDSVVKNLPIDARDWGSIPGEKPLEKEMATYSSILA